jgi:predicted nucleic acid-binding Zn ribbon protein
MGYYSLDAREESCVVCDSPLSGRQEVVCSERCRKARQRARKLTAAEARERLVGKDCAHCGDAFEPRSSRQRFCSENCAEHAREAGYVEREDAVCQLDGCENNAGWDGAGRARRYCSNAHRQKAYRQRKRSAPL